MIHDEINVIEKCFKTVVLKYQKKLVTNNLKNYLMYIDDSKINLTNLLQDYIIKCKEFVVGKTLTLQPYEKAACLAIAIKNNPCFIVTDTLGFINDTKLNSFFAVDVALKFCEINLIGAENKVFDKLFEEYEELSYSKQLLVDILEHRDVYPSDISNSFKLQSDLLIDMSNLKKVKIKKKI